MSTNQIGLGKVQNKPLNCGSIFSHVMPSSDNVDSLKYAELQNLAKTLGIRANLKVWNDCNTFPWWTSIFAHRKSSFLLPYFDCKYVLLNLVGNLKN